MTFRRRRRVNWFLVFLICAAVIAAGFFYYQRYGIPRPVRELPFLPQPTPTATPPIDDGVSSLARADTLWAGGKLDEAADQYARAITTTEKANLDFLRLAETLARAGKTAEADLRQADAQRALERSGVASARWCRILALRGHASDAIARCNRALEINTRSAEAFAYLALAYDRNGEYGKAIAAAQRAVDLEPANAEATSFLAEALADDAPFEKRNLETALKAIKLDDKSAFAHRNLGWVYESEGNYRSAAEEYQRAVELMPTLSYFYMDLCRAQRARQLTDEAIAACQKATELDTGNAETFDKLGLIYYDQFENEKALQAFQRAGEADAQYALAYGHQGWVYYFRLYQWEKAATAFQKALEAGAGRLSTGATAEFSTELGWSYYRLSRCSDARPAFDKAINLIGSNPTPATLTILQQAQQGLQACVGKK